MSVGEALARVPAAPQPGRLSMKLLAALLAPDDPADSELIDIYFHVRAVDGLPSGLYRLGARGSARLIRRGDLGRPLGDTLAAPEPARSPLQIAIAGAFARAAAASGERGYRLALMAAGARSPPDRADRGRRSASGSRAPPISTIASSTRFSASTGSTPAC